MRRRHTNRTYEAELDGLRTDLIAMAGRVEHLIAQSVRTFVSGDAKAAKAAIFLDRRINQAEVEIDEQCLGLLARRQPMGPDLRFITRAMKMVTDLERIADLAVNVCERTVQLAELDHATEELAKDIPEMGDIVMRMVRDAINAFVHADSDLAHAVIQQDDELDRLYQHVFRGVLAQMNQDPVITERGIHLQSAAKFLERMGDHATNLAEQVVFLVDGTDIRHEGKLAIL